MPRTIALAFCALAVAAGSDRSFAGNGWTPLFNGRDFTGWTLVARPSLDLSDICHFNPDGSVAVRGKPIGFVATTAEYRNFRLHVEWRWPAHAARNSNSGILLDISSGPKDRAWPICFQVQLKPTRAGDIFPMAGASFAEPLSSPPGSRSPVRDRRAESSERPLGEWNACDLTCRDGTIEVTVNGALQNRVTHVSPAAGNVGFQLEGTPYELRNVRLSVLK